MAPPNGKSAKAAASSQSDEPSQQPSQEMLQIEGDTLAQIAQMQNAKACSRERCHLSLQLLMHALSDCKAEVAGRGKNSQRSQEAH